MLQRCWCCHHNCDTFHNTWGITPEVEPVVFLVPFPQLFHHPIPHCPHPKVLYTLNEKQNIATVGITIVFFLQWQCSLWKISMCLSTVKCIGVSLSHIITLIFWLNHYNSAVTTLWTIQYLKWHQLITNIDYFRRKYITVSMVLNANYAITIDYQCHGTDLLLDIIYMDSCDYGIFHFHHLIQWSNISMVPLIRPVNTIWLAIITLAHISMQPCTSLTSYTFN